MANYKDLVVWQKSVALSVEVKKISKKLPKKDVLQTELVQCALNIPLKVVESTAYKGKPEGVNYLVEAMASIYKLQTLLDISLNLKYINQSNLDNLWELSKEVEKVLQGFIKSNNRNRNSNVNRGRRPHNRNVAPKEEATTEKKEVKETSTPPVANVDNEQKDPPLKGQQPINIDDL